MESVAAIFKNKKESRILSINAGDNNLKLDGNLSVFPRSVQSLELESNNMDTIQKDDFKGLSNLTHLDLQLNGIQRMAKGAFDTLRRLKSINLSGNNIRQLPRRIFQYNTNVSTIAIEKNYLTEFPDLTGIKQLTHLRLMRNNIKIVNGYKYGVHQVISIDLALNK